MRWGRAGRGPLGIPNRRHFFWGGWFVFIARFPRGMVVRMSPWGGAGGEKVISNNRSHRAFP